MAWPELEHFYLQSSAEFRGGCSGTLRCEFTVPQLLLVAYLYACCVKGKLPDLAESRWALVKSYQILHQQDIPNLTPFLMCFM